jgi:hypothetical protein
MSRNMWPDLWIDKESICCVPTTAFIWYLYRRTIYVLNVRRCLIQHPEHPLDSSYDIFPQISLLLYHQSPSQPTQITWSVLRNLDGAQLGSEEDRSDHPLTHCCGNLRAEATKNSSDFGCSINHLKTDLHPQYCCIVLCRCSWLTVADKIATNTGIHFQSEMPICFQEFKKYD